MMKQVIRKGLKKIVVDEVPDPTAIPFHLVIRPMCSLISSGTETASIHEGGLVRAVAEHHSELGKVWEALKLNPVRALAEIKAKFSEYAVLGYSGAGLVVDKHATVTDFNIGDRVAYGGEGTGHGEAILAGRNLVVRVPDSVPFEYACFATLGSIAINAIRIADIKLGETVAVLGLGLVGQLIAQSAKQQGGIVFGSDLRTERVELARRLGADSGLLASSSTRETINSLTDGRGVDCVIIAAASRSAEPCRQALEICRDRGRIVIVGAVDLSFPWFEMYRKEIQVLMARAYGPGCYDVAYEKMGQDYPVAHVRWTENRNMQEFLRLLALNRVQVGPLITHKFPLREAAKAYETIMNPQSGSLAVILVYNADTSSELKPFELSHRVPAISRAEAGSKIGVAVVGASNIARWIHLPNVKRIPRAYLRAVCSSNGTRAKSYALRFGATYCCSAYEEILRDPDVSVVVIASRNQYHASQALAALNAGKHVFVEKPMALTEEDCRSLCSAVRATRQQLTVGFNRRFAPSYAKLKEQLARRAGPAVVNCRVNSPGISGSYWMADPTIGGAILGEACHFVDLLSWLLESEPVEVSAFCLPSGNKEPVGENNLVASFRFADGAIGNLTYCTVGSKTSGGERVETFAPGFGLVSENFKRLEIRAGSLRTRSRWFAKKGYESQMRTFFKSLEEGEPPAVSVRDGARATIVCLRMLESARSLATCAINWEAVLD